MSTYGSPMTLILAGLTGPKYTITEIYPSDTVLKVKEKFKDKEDVPTDKVTLTYRNRVLEDSRALSDYNIPDGATIFMTLRLRGGNKRSRKTRKTGKTRKHRR